MKLPRKRDLRRSFPERYREGMSVGAALVVADAAFDAAEGLAPEPGEATAAESGSSAG
jgi:hypothetical protein